MDQIELDTATLKGAERMEAWAAAVTAAFGPFAIARDDPERFRGHVRVERRGDIRFIGLGYEGHGFRRRPCDVSRLSDAYYSLLRPRRGRLHIRQEGASHTLEPGNFYVVNHALPYETFPEHGYAAQALAFPPSALQARVARPQPFYALTGEPDCPRRALLAAFVDHFTAGRARWSDHEFGGLSTQLLDLVVLSVVEPGHAAAVGETSVRAAHRLRALRYIRANLSRRDLVPAKVAEACGISLSHLHDVFGCGDVGVEETIFAERLERAHALLTAPASAGVQIASIAYQLGFAHPAHFTRAFRRRFGRTPREIRG